MQKKGIRKPNNSTLVEVASRSAGVDLQQALCDIGRKHDKDCVLEHTLGSSLTLLMLLHSTHCFITFPCLGSSPSPRCCACAWCCTAFFAGIAFRLLLWPVQTGSCIHNMPVKINFLNLRLMDTSQKSAGSFFLIFRTK
uniref:Uncharacterized protein n=1 Tax=Nothobranchius pienaari TaxID=704102 RepID=A0A1A8QC95_9TELE